MTKGDLVNKIAADADISKAAAEKTVKAFVDGVSSALKNGDKVSLVGFGTFDVSNRAARKGRNPQTGEEIKIKASTSVGFKPSPKLKGSL